MIIAEDYSGQGLHLWHPYVFKYEFDFSTILPKLRPTYEAALNHWAAQEDQTKVETIPKSTTSRVGRYEHTLEQFGPTLKIPWTKLKAPNLTKKLANKISRKCQLEPSFCIKYAMPGKDI